jgi:flavin reductase (DIM6/NTAB) family NADH-FMN oxidoreductase RutF
MKAIIKKLVFCDSNPKNFPAVRIDHGLIQETAELVNGKNHLNVSSNHCIVCHAPFLVAIWLTQSQVQDFGQSQLQLQISGRGKIVAKAELSLQQKIDNGENVIAIFRVEEATCYQLSSIRQAVLYRYFKNKTNALESRSYATMYSYPRRVIAVSYRDESYYNMFPMDFQCQTGDGTFILGLRTTNVTIDRIIKSKKVLIGDAGQAALSTIYFLGGHHSKTPTPLNELPFKTQPSENFRFPVAEFSSSYQEVEIIQNYELGTHMLMIGKPLKRVELRKQESSIHHIHFFQKFASDYKPAE